MVIRIAKIALIMRVILAIFFFIMTQIIVPTSIPLPGQFLPIHGRVPFTVHFLLMSKFFIYRVLHICM
jgi:hypothetical protein